MPFVRRDFQGQILSVHRHAEGEAQEWLPDASAELASLLEVPPQQAFAQADADFVRVLEDLIDVLLARHVITITDLPPQARHKLLNRRDLRRESALSQLNLLGDETEFGLLPDGEPPLR